MGKATVRTSLDHKKYGSGVKKGKPIKAYRSRKLQWIIFLLCLNAALNTVILLKMSGVLDQWILKIL